MHTEAIMTPMPEGLSQQQVVSFGKYGLLPLFSPLMLCTNGSYMPLFFKHIGILLKWTSNSELNK